MSLFVPFTFDSEQIIYYLDLISSNKKKNNFFFLKKLLFLVFTHDRFMLE